MECAWSRPESDPGEALHAQGSKMRGVPTGFQDLDTVTGGLQGADLIIIATPAAASQVSLALSLALQVATTNQSGVGLLSLDMHEHHVVQRLLAMRTGIDLHRLRVGWVTEEERTLVTETAKTLSKARLWIDDTADLSLKELRQRARRLVEMHPISLLIVDNLHLIRSDVHSKQYENRFQEVGEIHRSLKVLADELTIPVVVFAPIVCPVTSRHAKSPQRSDQGESSPEKAMDHVFFLYRDEFPTLKSESTNIVIGRMIITKHHNGLVTELAISI